MIFRAAGDHVAPILAHTDATRARWAVDVAVAKVFLLDGWRRFAAGQAAHGAAVRRPRLNVRFTPFLFTPFLFGVPTPGSSRVWSFADAVVRNTLNIDRLCQQAGVSLREGRFALESHLAIAVRNGSLHILHAHLHILLANLHAGHVCE